MPEMEYPTISVTTRYEGVAPEEMETLVSRPLEQALASAPGVEEITSRSSEGNSNVRVRFVYGSDLDEAANELRARIDRRRGSLPEDIEPPIKYKFDVSQFPIMFLSIRSDEMDAKQLRHFAEKNLQYRFERLPGVAQARVFGGLRRQIHVYLDLKKLRALNLSVAQWCKPCGARTSTGRWVPSSKAATRCCCGRRVSSRISTTSSTWH